MLSFFCTCLWFTKGEDLSIIWKFLSRASWHFRPHTVQSSLMQSHAQLHDICYCLYCYSKCINWIVETCYLDVAIIITRFAINWEAVMSVIWCGQELRTWSAPTIPHRALQIYITSIRIRIRIVFIWQKKVK